MPIIYPAITPSSTLNQQHFSHLVHRALETAESETTKRDYWRTYRKWLTWCHANQMNPADLRPGYVLIFLNEQATTKGARHRYLLALRKLAQTDYRLNPTDDNRYTVEALQTIKVSPLAHFTQLNLSSG